MAERAMLRKLFAGCLSPVGASSSVSGNKLTLTGVVLSTDGKHRIEATETASLESSNELGISVAQKLIENGASEFLRGE